MQPINYKSVSKHGQAISFHEPVLYKDERVWKKTHAIVYTDGTAVVRTPSGFRGIAREKWKKDKFQGDIFTVLLNMFH